MDKKIEDNFKPKKLEEKTNEAKNFSLFEFTFEILTHPRSEIGNIPGLDKFYQEYDEFINQAYLRGKELSDSSFVDKIFQTFRNTHQSGLGIKEYLEKIGKPEVVEFFKQHGQKFLKEIVGGGETEIYQQFSCKFKTE